MQQLLDEGRQIFRFDTFGDEAFWGDTLKLHQALAHVSPNAALALGLKVDLDALPPDTVAALSRQGVEAVLTLDGATDAKVLRAYVEQVLCPTWVLGDIVGLDNLRAHNVAGLRIEACGAPLISWPPYSPDLSPIEPCWSKLKTLWRAAQARTRDALDATIQQVLAAVTPSAARRWCRHRG